MIFNFEKQLLHIHKSGLSSFKRVYYEMPSYNQLLQLFLIKFVNVIFSFCYFTFYILYVSLVICWICFLLHYRGQTTLQLNLIHYLLILISLHRYFSENSNCIPQFSLTLIVISPIVSNNHSLCTVFQCLSF